jgi:hypothetical protein
MVTSAARPSAPSAAALNDVAIEKNTTVPRSAVARIAPPSHPGTSTQTTVTSAGPPAPLIACDSATGSRASARTVTSVSPPTRSSRSISRCTGTTPTTRSAPAARAAATDSDPLLPAAPMTATTGGRPASTYDCTTRVVSAGAPHTSMTASASSGDRSSGSRAAIERPNSTA